MLDQRLITENTSNICSTCCEKNRPNSENKPYTHEETESVSDNVSVVEQLEWQSNIESHDDSIEANSTATTEFHNEILETLLAPVAVLIKQDIAKLWKDKSCTKADDLVNYKPSNWVKERPLSLIKLLEKFTNNGIKTEHGYFRIAYLTEQLYSSRNEKLVLPIELKYGGILTLWLCHFHFDITFSHTVFLIVDL